MSRFYEALKKAESRQHTTPFVAAPVVARRSPEFSWELTDDVRLEYERLQVWLRSQSSLGKPLQTVMIASCQGGGGTTTTAVRLASTLARQPAVQVLVVDANVRTPTLDLLFDVRNRGGFSDLVSNGAGIDYVQATTRPNLFLLTAGRASRAQVDLYAPAGMTRLLTLLKPRFDYILFDAPPLATFADAYALAPYVDAVLLVVEADKTRVEDARRVLRELERVGAPAAGVVLNRQRDYTPRLFRRFLSRQKKRSSAR